MTSLKLPAAAAALLLSAGSLVAGPDAKMVVDQPVAEDPWNICDIFDLGKIYKDGDGMINSISFIGRYQGQYHWSDSNQSETVEDWDNRRARAGIQIEFLDNFKFYGQFNLDLEGDGRFLKDVEDLYISWKPDGPFYAIVGKIKANVTREWTTSSTKIKTIERSQLVNQIVPDKIGGFVLGYNASEKITLEGGTYFGSNSEDWLLPFDGDSSIAALGRVVVDVTENTNVSFDYFYADGAGEDRSVEDYEHILSLNSESDWDRMHLVTDLIYAKGTDSENHADAFGIVAMPYYDLTDKLEAVFRYTYSTADSDSGIRLQSRYERETANDTRGDNYHAFYGGLNYYICEDKLKLMTGIEYSTMDQSSGDEYENWSVFTGIRLSF